MRAMGVSGAGGGGRGEEGVVFQPSSCSIKSRPESLKWNLIFKLAGLWSLREYSISNQVTND